MCVRVCVTASPVYEHTLNRHAESTRVQEPRQGASAAAGVAAHRGCTWPGCAGGSVQGMRTCVGSVHARLSGHQAYATT